MMHVRSQACNAVFRGGFNVVHRSLWPKILVQGEINQSIYFIFHKSITRRTPYGYRNGQENIYTSFRSDLYNFQCHTLYKGTTYKIIKYTYA